MSLKSAFSVTKALRDAVEFLPQAWSGAWLVLVLLLAAVAGLPLLMGGHQLPIMLPPVLFVFVVLLLKLISQGALYRIALFGNQARNEGLGFGGFQIARPELRLLVASLVVAVFVAIIAATLFIVFAIALSQSGLTAGHESSLATVKAMAMRHTGLDNLFVGYIAAAWLFLVFVALKFALMPAANIAERRLVTLNALGLSSGNVGKLFIGIVVILLPFIVAGIALAHHFGPEILVAHLLPHAYGPAKSLLALHVALLALDILVLFPLLVGFFASAYRQIVAIRSK